MKKRIAGILLIGVLLLTASTSFAFASSSITKEYSFTAESSKKLSYDAEKTIKVDGKEYKLKNIKYKTNPIKETVATEITDKNDFKSTITKIVDGKEYVLTAEEPKWETTTKSQTQEYLSKNDIPSTYEFEGESLELTNTEPSSKTESFSSPATFVTTGIPTTLYYFDGNLVKINGNDPLWSGYQTAVASYLGLNSDYKVTGGNWATDFVKDNENNVYIRTATYTGTKTTNFFVATFSKTTYKADVEYSNADTGKIDAIAMVTYEPAGLTTAQIIAIGVGVLIFAALIAAILLFLMKRKKSKE